MSLPKALAAARPIDGGFATTIPDDWMQGRTSYGGFSAALALVAAQNIDRANFSDHVGRDLDNDLVETRL